MKSIAIILGALPLLQLALAQPHRVRHAHQNKHVKKDDGVAVVTVIDTVYVEPSPEVIVFVNQFGTPLSTMTEGILDSPPKIWSTLHGATPTPAPEPEPTPTSAKVEVASAAPAVASPEPVVVPAPAVTTPAPVVTPSPTVEAAAVVAPVSEVAAPVVNIAVTSTPVAVAPAASETGTSSTPKGNGFGFSYSPYNSDNSCKDQEQVNEDFAKIGDSYSLVRTYGVDCNQTATVLTAAKNHNMKLFAGIFSLGSLSDDVQKIADAANGDWSSFDTVSVGNEMVNSGTASPAAVVSAIGSVRSLLQGHGYTGNVVTVDTLVAARANPSLCDASDFCGVNSHPFFDGNVVAKSSGDFLTTQISTLRAVLANKNQEIRITETGWPTQGLSNGAAVPSTSNQADAISSIKAAFSTNPSSVILFTAFNDMWKTNSPAQFEAEQFWGFLGNSPSG